MQTPRSVFGGMQPLIIQFNETPTSH